MAKASEKQIAYLCDLTRKLWESPNHGDYASYLCNLFSTSVSMTSSIASRLIRCSRSWLSANRALRVGDWRSCPWEDEYMSLVSTLETL